MSTTGGGGSDPAHLDAPPVGEELHLPASSAVPMLNAVGATIALLGLIFGLPVIIVGLVIFLWTLVRWIRDVRRDVDHLPRSH